LWKTMGEFNDANIARVYQQDEVKVELLIVALIEGQFRILSLDEHGPRDHPYFGAIGTGQDSAMSSLRWRSPTDFTDMHAAIYFAYEAKRMGEVSPYVGKLRTYINVLKPVDDYGILCGVVTGDGIVELGKAFRLFGPQSFNPQWRLSKDSLVL
ncbi:MAG TPA: hypothetical protein VEU96_26890, partial [Bryobacteraceae bacterium]|nr:hypothetical protein [Bryobacteraceae bacterium]